MSYYFENKNRYQVIFPYTSDKIHVETDIDHGAYKCYQELKEQDIRTYIFMVHDIDSGMIYYFNIPKFKHLDTKNPDVVPVTMAPSTLPTTIPATIPATIPTTIPATTQTSMSVIIPTKIPNTMSGALIESHVNQPEVYTRPDTHNQFSQKRQNEIITRLNHVEYQLETLKKMIIQKPKKEEDGCIIL